jgi:hypothetical protein
MNGVLAMVSPGFFDKLIGHSKVEEARRQPRSGVIRLVQGPQHCRRVRPRRDHQVKPRLLARNPDSGRGREGIECDRRHETDHAGRLGAAHRNAASLRVSARAAVAARRRQCAAQQERPRQAERRPRGGAQFTRIAGRSTVVVFILVPQITLQKRLDIASAAQRWADRVPGLLASHWR